jgi:hypothetical protein
MSGPGPCGVVWAVLLVAGCAKPAEPVSPRAAETKAPPLPLASVTVSPTPVVAPALALLQPVTAVASDSGGDSGEDPYRRAVHDAAHATERNDSLVKLSCAKKQSGVEWKDAKCSRVKAVSVMTADSVKYWKGRTSSEWQYLSWVTAAPELETFCTGAAQSSLSPEELVLRVQQWLGLPSTKRYDKVIEVWVESSRLRRPCSNPKVDEAGCRAQGKVACSGDATCEAFKLWLDYNDLKNQATEGYPFTRLGYTYDWSEVSASSGKPGLGATEFVVLPDTPYEIVAPGSRELAEYCGPKP